MSHQLRMGDKFNDKARGPYRSNGYICRIQWREKEVVVRFYTRGHYNGNDTWASYEYAEYSFDEIEDCWEERFEYYVMPSSYHHARGWLEEYLDQVAAEYGSR